MIDGLRVFSRILTFILCFTVAGHALIERAAAAPSDTRHKLDEISKKLQGQKERLSRLARKETSILAELEKADRLVRKEQRALRQVEEKIRALKKERRALNNAIGELENKISRSRDILKKRLRAVYRQVKEGSLAALASAEDYQALIRRAKYLAYFADHDRRLIEGYRKDWSDLQEKRSASVALESRLDAVRKERTARKARLDKTRKEKRALLTRVRAERNTRQQLIEELSQASRDLENVLREEEELRKRQRSEVAPPRALGDDGKSFDKMKGGLRWPVRGRLVSRFGSQKDPEFNTPVFRNGIEIAAPEGTNVEAVLGGTVVFADHFRGFGNLVIVDHGMGYHTLYAHLSDSSVIAGEHIRRGQVVGRVGESGLGGTVSLYFEVRRRGKPIDPIPWLARRK